MDRSSLGNAVTKICCECQTAVPLIAVELVPPGPAHKSEPYLASAPDLGCHLVTQTTSLPLSAKQVPWTKPT